MAIHYHKFEVRWSDLDANKHLANSSYVTYCAQARMSFMAKNNVGLAELNRWGIGPVILHERYSFFKEIYMNQMVYVSLELDGFSEDGGIYRFLHKFYLEDGTHCATSEAFGVWIDMMLRKSTTPPDEILVFMHKFKSENAKLFSKADIKELPFRPDNIDPSILKNF